jgi:NTE family protein
MASSCIPGVFEPVEIDGRLLVDGGVVENVPLTPLREMGADFLIGAQLSTTPREKPDNIVQVLVNSFIFALKAATEVQIGEADMILRPDLTDFSMFDTSQVDKLIDVGYEEAKAKLEQLR